MLNLPIALLFITAFYYAIDYKRRVAVKRAKQESEKRWRDMYVIKDSEQLS